MMNNTPNETNDNDDDEDDDNYDYEKEMAEFLEYKRRTAVLMTQRPSLQEFSGVYRQPSQRNRKNLVVNVVPRSGHC